MGALKPGDMVARRIYITNEPETAINGRKVKEVILPSLGLVVAAEEKPGTWNRNEVSGDRAVLVVWGEGSGRRTLDMLFSEGLVRVGE